MKVNPYHKAVLEVQPDLFLLREYRAQARSELQRTKVGLQKEQLRAMIRSLDVLIREAEVRKSRMTNLWNNPSLVAL
jgi:hypothetical protein